MATKAKKIDESISEFISSIATKYKLDENDLIKQWEEKFTIQKNIQKNIPNTERVPDEVLNNSTVAVLKEFCKNRGLKVSGTKAVLISRLKGEEETPKKKTPPKKRKIISDKTAIKIEEKSTILQKLKSEVPTIEIRRNNFGNYTHPETNLVFQKDENGEVVIGHQNNDGSIGHLSKNDIQLCKKFKFKYSGIPENLNEQNEEEEIEELEDEEEEELEEIIEEIEEETDDIEEDEEEYEEEIIEYVEESE